jgi:hypothetical protein
LSSARSARSEDHRDNAFRFLISGLQRLEDPFNQIGLFKSAPYYPKTLESELRQLMTSKSRGVFGVYNGSAPSQPASISVRNLQQAAAL